MNTVMQRLRSLEIRTNRLRLLPLDAEALLLLQESRRALELHFGLTESDLQMSPGYQREVGHALHYWLDFVRAHPKDFRWGTNWEIVLEAENRSIGGIGFGGPPDAEGKVTVGYLIDQRYRGRGFATETLGALCQWAFQHPDLKRIEALTPVDNRASQRVLRKTGFRNGAVRTLDDLRLLPWWLDKPPATPRSVMN